MCALHIPAGSSCPNVNHMRGQSTVINENRDVGAGNGETGIFYGGRNSIRIQLRALSK